jgi:hypothetical protein
MLTRFLGNVIGYNELEISHQDCDYTKYLDICEKNGLPKDVSCFNRD